MPKVIGGSIENHRRETRDRIFTALSKLMYERGYDAVTLADVAASAGMSRTAIYNYFPDKDALLVGFAAYETERYVSDLDAALAPIDNPIDRLRTYLQMQLRYFASHHLPPGPALRALLSEAAYQQVLDHVAALEQALRQILLDGIAEGYLPDEDVEATMPLVTAIVNRGGTVDLDPAALDDATQVTVTFVLRALGVRLTPEGRPKRLPRR